jgi:hypothetical protein
VDAQAADQPDSSVAPGTPDAAPGSSDATPVTPTPDAAPFTPDATGCTSTIVQYLNNSAFDSGPTAWTESGAGYPIILSTNDPTYPLPVTPDSGTYAGWLGGIDDATRSVYQDVAIPAGATNVELVGVRWIASEETSTTTDWDTFTLTVRSTSNAVLETVDTLGNTDQVDAWVAMGGPLSGSYAGQTIRAHFESDQDFINNTNFFVDTVAVRATVCQ